MSKLNPLAIVLLVVGIGSFAAVLAYSSYYATSYAGWNWQQQNQYPNQNQGQMMRQLTQTQAYTSASSPITMDQAKAIAEQYLSSVNNPNLAIHEIMEFQNNFYIIYYEKDTARGAFEMLIWKQAPSSRMMGGGMGMGMGGGMMTGVIMPEPGPNMMWNTKYGHMGGMMGGWRERQAGPMSVTPERAWDIAQGWLDQFLPGTSAAQQADAFYGYYTIHVMKEGQVYGMLSVNSYTGDVWYHNWHEDFIDMKVLEE